MWLRSIEPFSCLWMVDTLVNRSGNSGDMWTVSGREWWWRERETPEIRKASSRSYEQKSLGRRMHVQSGFFRAFYLQDFLCEALVICLFLLCPSPSLLCSSQHHSRQDICKLPLQTPLGRILGSGWQWKALARDWKVEEGKTNIFSHCFAPGSAFGKWQSWAPRAPVTVDAPVAPTRLGPVGSEGAGLPASRSDGWRRNSSILSSTATGSWGFGISFSNLHPPGWCSTLHLIIAVSSAVSNLWGTSSLLS